MPLRRGTANELLSSDQTYADLTSLSAPAYYTDVLDMISARVSAPALPSMELRGPRWGR